MYAQYSNYFPTQEPESHEYSLIISSSKCPYSKKIIDLLQNINLSPQLEVYDVQHFIKSGQRIPEYVDGVPQLIISSSGGQIQDVKLGYRQVSTWINDNKPKECVNPNAPKKTGSSGNSSFTSISESHGKCRLPPPKIQLDEYGRPVDTCDTSIFSVPTEPRPKSDGVDLNTIQQERDNLNKEMGIPNGGPPIGTQSSRSGPPEPASAGASRRLQPAGGGGGYSGRSSGGMGGYSPVGK